MSNLTVTAARVNGRRHGVARWQLQASPAVGYGTRSVLGLLDLRAPTPTPCRAARLRGSDSSVRRVGDGRNVLAPRGAARNGQPCRGWCALVRTPRRCSRCALPTDYRNLCSSPSSAIDAFWSSQRSSTGTGTKTRLPRRTTRSSGRTCSSKKSREQPIAAAASSGVNARRGTSCLPVAVVTTAPGCGRELSMRRRITGAPLAPAIHAVPLATTCRPLGPDVLLVPGDVVRGEVVLTGEGVEELSDVGRLPPRHEHEIHVQTCGRATDLAPRLDDREPRPCWLRIARLSPPPRGIKP